MSSYSEWTVADMSDDLSHRNADHVQVELARQLGVEQRLLTELERLLREEREALQQTVSPEHLEQACHRRQQCMGELLRLQEERNQWLLQAGVTADIAGLLQLIRRSHVPGALPSQWAECAALAKRCRNMNQQNGALVASRMRRVQGVLDILIGQGADAAPATYSRQLTDSARPSGRVLCLEA